MTNTLHSDMIRLALLLSVNHLLQSAADASSLVFYQFRSQHWDRIKTN